MDYNTWSEEKRLRELQTRGLRDRASNGTVYVLETSDELVRATQKRRARWAKNLTWRVSSLRVVGDTHANDKGRWGGYNPTPGRLVRFSSF